MLQTGINRMIRSARVMAGVVATVFLSSASASAQNTVSDVRATVATEVLELHADVLQYLLKAQKDTVQLLKRDFDELVRQERRIADEEAGRNRQLTEIDQHLSNPDLDADARAEVEGIRQQLDTELAAKLGSDREVLRARKAEVTAKLDFELHQEQALQHRAELVREALGR